MKNTLKRDPRAKGGGEGGVVVLSSVRLAGPGKPAGNGRRGEPAPVGAARLAAPRAAEALPASPPEKRVAVRRRLRAAAKARARRGTPRMSRAGGINESQPWPALLPQARH